MKVQNPWHIDASELSLIDEAVTKPYKAEKVMVEPDLRTNDELHLLEGVLPGLTEMRGSTNGFSWGVEGLYPGGTGNDRSRDFNPDTNRLPDKRK